MPWASVGATPAGTRLSRDRAHLAAGDEPEDHRRDGKDRANLVGREVEAERDDQRDDRLDKSEGFVQEQIGALGWPIYGAAWRLRYILTWDTGEPAPPVNPGELVPVGIPLGEGMMKGKFKGGKK